jgi:hypothetical protein
VQRRRRVGVSLHMVDLLADRWHRLFGALCGGVLFVAASGLIYPYVHLGEATGAKTWFFMFTSCFAFALGAWCGAALIRHLGRAVPTVPTLLPRARLVRR